MEIYEHASPDIGYFIYRNCTQGWRIEESIIDFIDLTYVVSGSAEYSVGDKKITVTGGDLLCIPKGSLRSATGTFNDPPESYAANFHYRAFDGGELDLPFPLICHIGYHADIVSLYRELNSEWLRREQGYRVKAKAHLLLILQRYFELIIYRNDSWMMDSRIKKAIRHITDNYAQQLTIGGVAAYAGLNHVYFGSLFRNETGMTFRQYLTGIRLNHAENMLRSGEYNVNETAMMCGFSDIFYFSKVFKEKKGVSPSKLMRSVGDAE